ncbi:MAG: cytochrome c biogenesis protein ResB, partial [Gammaproteobacteria bacterium]|nr:cytochrome c biogenesis protein ResB [Gammaproteobacteria bacterium]
MQVPSKSPRSPASLIRIWLQFLGSMNLAITLFVGIAVASIIGTVLRQNEPYQDYIIKFGPFWHEFFNTLGLYDVYASGWFVFALTFLVISTSVCIIRNTPVMIRNIRAFGENIQERSLVVLPKHTEWTVNRPLASVLIGATEVLSALGYRLRIKDHGTHTIVAAMKGASNRAGHLLTHLAIVTICTGGLLDGNLSLKLKALTGHIAIETRDIPASQVPSVSRLPQDNPSFRGNVSIPEGSAADVAFINIANGYVVQDLPFVVEVKAFRVAHYFNGQPKSFETDLLIHDRGRDTPLRYTLAVNHPLTYKGYTLYQASFGDGGSKLHLESRPLNGDSNEDAELTGEVNEVLSLSTPGGPLRLELTDFRRFNVQPIPDGDASGKKFRDVGPSFTYKLRWPDGVAKEYVNYMYPMTVDGRQFYLSGVRSSPAEEFEYLHIPADAANKPDRFLRFQVLLHDDKRLAKITKDTTR